MRKKTIDRLRELIEQEENETILYEVLEYMKVLKAFRTRARNPPTPEEWARLPRRRQIQIALICEMFYLLHLFKKWFSDQCEKGWLLWAREWTSKLTSKS